MFCIRVKHTNTPPVEAYARYHLLLALSQGIWLIIRPAGWPVARPSLWLPACRVRARWLVPSCGIQVSEKELLIPGLLINIKY